MKKAKFKMTGNGSRIEKFSESSCLCASVLKKDAGVVEGDFNTETQRLGGTEFKMTEIGLIPEDWEVKPLSSIGIFSKGRGISRSESNSGVLPCVRYGEIYTDHNDYIKEFKSFISESVAINAKRLVDGDILFAGSGETKEEIGKSVAYLGGAERVYCGGDILVLSPFSDFDSKFLGYVCNSQAAVSQKSTRGQGDAVVHIRTSNLAEVLIPVPPLPEQKKIAEALSDVDELLAAMTTLIEKKRAIKQGAMQELLGIRNEGEGMGIRNEELGMRNCGVPRRRLPGFSGEWTEKRLGEIASFETTTIDVAKIDSERYVGTENMISEKAGIEKNQTPIPYRMVREYKVGDVLISNIRPYLKKIWLADRDGGCSSDVLVVRTLDSSVCLPTFLKMLLSDDLFFDFVMANAVGTKMPRGDKKVIVNYEVCLPTLAEQEAIAEVLSDMDAEIEALEAKRAKYESIKQGMMQELLTGKTRLV